MIYVRDRRLRGRCSRDDVADGSSGSVQTGSHELSAARPFFGVIAHGTDPCRQFSNRWRFLRVIELSFGTALDDGYSFWPRAG
jgi:hypothetical protein